MLSAGRSAGSFHDFGDDEEIVRLARRVAQCFLGREPIARFVFAEDIENRNRMRRRFHLSHVDLAQFLGVIQNVAELLLKKFPFLRRSD